MGSNQGARILRSARIVLTIFVAVALVYVALLMLERGGSSPIHTLNISNHPTTTTTSTTSTTSTTINNSPPTTMKNCNDNDNNGEGGPKDKDPQGECNISGT